MISASVSNIDLYRVWSEEEALDISWLVNKIMVREQTEKMMAGEAFHKAVEGATSYQNHDVLSANGYVFHLLPEMEIELPALRECPLEKVYDGMLVKGRVDAIGPRIVTEIKTTEQFDPDRYLEGLQWRFYLDISGADRFDWHIFQMSSCGDKEYEVYGHHKLTQFNYPRVHGDCLKAADKYKNFAEKFLPVAA